MASPKRPRDTNQLAKMVVDIASGVSEVADHRETSKSPAHKFASEGGVKGGRARAAALTQAQRREIARAAAIARWSKPKD